jgi:hypothetical protein
MLTDMFQVCSKLTFRNKGCLSKIKDVHFLTFLMVIIEPKMLTTTMKQWNRTMVKFFMGNKCLVKTKYVSFTTKK